MTTFFGERWDAPIVDDATQVPTPAGRRCYDCGEPIEGCDRGFVRATASQTPSGGMVAEAVYIHAECDLRGVVGHIAGFCSCTGYPPGRATARLVWASYYGGRS